MYNIKNTNQKIVGDNPAMKRIYDTIEKIKDYDCPVMIVGETGTGKELVAKALHYNSVRGNKAYHSINCSALPETLLESALFGHAKGAFTSAYRTTEGFFDKTNEGTIALDEIGRLSKQGQSKLLKVCDEGYFYRVGSQTKIPNNSRILAVTQYDTLKNIQSDLLYRVNSITINVPPLRERVEDIPKILNHYLKFFSKKYDKEISYFSSEEMTKLKSHKWDGNVRELAQVAERKILLGNFILEGFEEKPITDIITQFLSPIEKLALMPIEATHMTWNEIDTWGLEYCGMVTDKCGTAAQAAKILDINRTTLVAKLKKLRVLKCQ